MCFIARLRRTCLWRHVGWSSWQKERYRWASQRPFLCSARTHRWGWSCHRLWQRLRFTPSWVLVSTKWWSKQHVDWVFVMLYILDTARLTWATVAVIWSSSSSLNFLTAISASPWMVASFFLLFSRAAWTYLLTSFSDWSNLCTWFSISLFL